MAPREEPTIRPAKSPPSDPSQGAAIIFMHGLGDTGSGLEGIAQQFETGNKLPYAQWIFPNALDNLDAMARAWYYPTPLAAAPSQRPELDDPEDEDGLKLSRKYVVGLLDELVEKQGVPPNRIVLAGFSQGHAMTLFTGLTSGKYAGRLAGLAGMCGYLPMADKIEELREEAELSKEIGKVPIFVARGGKDMLVPRRYHNISMEKLNHLGVKEEVVETHEYEYMGHGLTGEVLKDFCVWLEKVLPPIS